MLFDNKTKILQKQVDSLEDKINKQNLQVNSFKRNNDHHKMQSIKDISTLDKQLFTTKEDVSELSDRIDTLENNLNEFIKVKSINNHVPQSRVAMFEKKLNRILDHFNLEDKSYPEKNVIEKKKK